MGNFDQQIAQKCFDHKIVHRCMPVQKRLYAFKIRRHRLDGPSLGPNSKESQDGKLSFSILRLNNGLS